MDLWVFLMKPPALSLYSSDSFLFHGFSVIPILVCLAYLELVYQLLDISLHFVVVGHLYYSNYKGTYNHGTPGWI